MFSNYMHFCVLLFLLLPVAAERQIIKKSSKLYIKEAFEKINDVVECMVSSNNCTQDELQILNQKIKNEEEEKKLIYYTFEKINTKINTILKTQTFKVINRLNIINNGKFKLKEEESYHLENYFKNYTHFIENGPKFDDHALAQFISAIKIGHNSPEKLIKIIFEKLIKKTNLINYLTEQKTICETKLSPKEVIEFYYELFLLYEIKVYTMIQFSFVNYRKMTDNPHSNISEIEETKLKHKSRLDQLSETFKNLIDQAPNLLYNCDPSNHTNETYVELTRLIQGIILNQKNMDQNGNCYSTCASYKQVDKTYNCDNEEWCSSDKSCKNMFDCQSIPNAKVCRSKNGIKRYDKVEASEKISYNKENSCNTKSLDRSSYRLFWECAYCFCSCDEGSSISSDRYISLRASTSDFKNNSVVVGVRFIKHNRIVHLQVQEGQLGPYGFIKPDTVRWVKPINFKITDRKTFGGQDFHQFSMKERAIDLDNIAVPEDHIVTGVRFRRVGSPARIQLEVLTSKYNYTSGNVNPYDHKYVQPNSTKREQVKIENAIPPNKCESDVNYGPDKSVEFSLSDVKTDAGQTTIPFFDLQPVNSKIPVPLSGIGLYYRGNFKGNCGGFIAPNIFTYHNFKVFDIGQINHKN